MRLSKSQSAVIILLNVIIALLLCFIFLFPQLLVTAPPKGDGDTPNDVPGIVDPHEKLRAAKPGKTSDILRETQLMGSGDETVLGAYNVDGNIYIFGNATVGDYDFDDYGGFLCVLENNGKIARFEYFTGRMTAVAVVENGFAVATVAEAGTQRERNILYEVGDAVREAAELDGTALDVLAVDPGRIAVVIKKNDNCIRLTEYAISDGKYNRDRSTDVSSGYDLDYFDCYILGERYIVTARARSLPRYDSIMFFVFEAGGDPIVHTYGGSGESLLQPYAVMPYEKGYIVLARRGGTATVIGVDYSFKSYKRDLLDFAFDDAKLVHDGKNYYACFITGGSAVTYALDDELKTGEKITALDGATLDKATNEPSLFFAVTGSALSVISKVDGGKTTLELAGATVFACFINSDGVETVVISASGGNAVSAPIGGKDIYVLALRR